MSKTIILRIAFAAVVASTGIFIGAGATAASAYMSPAEQKFSRSSDAPLTSSSITEAVAGKRDAGLAAALRRVCRPTWLVDYTTTLSGANSSDIFTGELLTISSALQGYVAGGIVPSQWWTDRSSGAVNIYGDTIGRDLNNIAFMHESAYSDISGLPVGEPSRIIADHATWQRGTLNLYGVDVSVWSPAESERGRVARAYLYMALIYPQRSLTPTGMMLMPAGNYSLSDYWRQLFLRWSADYPPTRAEQENALSISQAQGGANPFVVLPGIEEYLWGEKRGEIYGNSTQSPATPVPLHGTYTCGEIIYLTSPHVPADAVWEIDGKSVSAPVNEGEISTLSTSEIAVGTHRLTYTSPSTQEKGCVIIVIKQ